MEPIEREPASSAEPPDTTAQPIEPIAAGDAGEAGDLTELPELVVLELDGRIAAGTAAGESADPDQVVRDLRLDRAMAAAHSRLASEVVAAGDSSLCRECHEPRPCTTTTEIAAKYALTTP